MDLSVVQYPCSQYIQVIWKAIWEHLVCFEDISSFSSNDEARGLCFSKISKTLKYLDLELLYPKLLQDQVSLP